MVFGATTTDVPIYAGVALVLTEVALLASWLPARRASTHASRFGPTDPRQPHRRQSACVSLAHMAWSALRTLSAFTRGVSIR